jgi:hypothetical protein
MRPERLKKCVSSLAKTCKLIKIRVQKQIFANFFIMNRQQSRTDAQDKLCSSLYDYHSTSITSGIGSDKFERNDVTV